MNIRNTAKFFIVFVALFFAMPVFASKVYIQPDLNNLKVGDEFKADFVFDSKDQINALEGVIRFDEQTLSLKNILSGNSFVSLWIKNPRIGGKNKIVFSGIIPGGYSGTNGRIFSAVFKAQKSGQAKIDFEYFKALKNDGLGTVSYAIPENYIASIAKADLSDSARIFSQDKDAVPPDIFTPKVAKNELIFDNKWFLSFSGSDKDSGINYFQVKESKSKFLSFFEKWNIAQSPYLLEDQALKSYIYVRAVDKSGNKRVSTIKPAQDLSWYENYEIIFLVIILVVIVIIIWKLRFFAKK